MTDEGSLQKKLPLALKQKDEEKESQEKNTFCTNFWRKSARIFVSSQYLRPDHNLLLNKLKIREN